MAASASGNYQLPVSIRTIKDVDRSGHWLAEGWRDFTLAPGLSLIYGGAFVVAGLAITLGLFTRGLASLILPLAGGLMILAPIMVVGLYDVSRRLEAGLPVSLRDCFRAFGRSVGQLSVLGVVVLVAYLFWVMTALLLFMLVLPAFTWVVSPLLAAWSRRHEYEADAFAAQHADARALAEALVILYKDNATTLTPDPLYSAFHDSHPPPAARIARLRSKFTPVAATP